MYKHPDIAQRIKTSIKRNEYDLASLDLSKLTLGTFSAVVERRFRPLDRQTREKLSREESFRQWLETARELKRELSGTPQ